MSSRLWRRRVALVLAAFAPFAPSVWGFIRGGIPDVLFFADSATLELRVLQASRGLQLLGPYSRFHWSHPGPLFFYLTVPFYAALGHRGPALNVAALVINMAACIGIVWQAERLRGFGFACAVSALLALFVAYGAGFSVSSEWNPFVPVLPLGLLALLSARLACGVWNLLPVAAVVASGIVQTHVGFAPATVTLVAAGLVTGLARHSSELRASRRAAAFTAAALLIVWAPPLYEQATSTTGNFTLLWRFFTGPSFLQTPSWRVAFETAAVQLSLPVASVIRPFVDWQVSPVEARVVVAFLVLGLVVAACRHEEETRALALVSLAGLMATPVAVHAVRGELLPYLLCWIPMVGVVAWAAALAGAAWLWERPGKMPIRVALGALLVIILAVCTGKLNEKLALCAGPVPEAITRANEARSHLRGHEGEPFFVPVTQATWPIDAAVVLDLAKHGVRVRVPPEAKFMFPLPSDQDRARDR